jgi:hypothetical protein
MQFSLDGIIFRLNLIKINFSALHSKPAILKIEKQIERLD